MKIFPLWHPGQPCLLTAQCGITGQRTYFGYITKDIKLQMGNFGGAPPQTNILSTYISDSSPETKLILYNSRMDIGELVLELSVSLKACLCFFFFFLLYYFLVLTKLYISMLSEVLWIIALSSLCNPSTKCTFISLFLFKSLGTHLCSPDNMLISQFIKLRQYPLKYFDGKWSYLRYPPTISHIFPSFVFHNSSALDNLIIDRA